MRKAKERQAKRFYATNDPTWRAIRGYVLRHEPLCLECRKSGITRAATVVDHIDGDTSNNTLENLASLCKVHHDRKSGRDYGFGSEWREKKLVAER